MATFVLVGWCLVSWLLLDCVSSGVSWAWLDLEEREAEAKGSPEKGALGTVAIINVS
jgi:hypothetical protein